MSKKLKPTLPFALDKSPLESGITGRRIPHHRYLQAIDSHIVAIVRTCENGAYAHYGKAQARANAEFIVRACNSHEHLCNALQRITEKVERANSIQRSGGKILPEDWAELWDLANDARTTLQAAGAN